MRIGKEARVQAETSVRTPSRPAMSDEERRAMAEALMKLPKDRVVPALRSAGLDDEADAFEQRLAEEHILELRLRKLEEIEAMPEDERLAALVQNGFDEEARVLSEKMAAERELATEPAGEAAAVPEKKEPARKKTVRPRKQRK
jgi:hypothetical protein